MAAIKILEKTPVLRQYIAKIAADERAINACVKEKVVRRKYIELGYPQEQVWGEIKNQTGEESPEHSFCLERLVHLFPQGEEQEITDHQCWDLTSDLMDIMRSYTNAAVSAYEALKGQVSNLETGYPLELMKKVVEWADFPNLNQKTELPKLVLSSGKKAQDFFDVAVGLLRDIDPQAKILMVGPKLAVGGWIWEAMSRLAKEETYYSRAMNRMDLNYFVNEQVATKGVDLHEQVVVDLYQKAKGIISYTKIEREGEAWLLKVELGKTNF